MVQSWCEEKLLWDSVSVYRNKCRKKYGKRALMKRKIDRMDNDTKIAVWVNERRMIRHLTS